MEKDFYHRPKVRSRTRARLLLVFISTALTLFVVELGCHIARSVSQPTKVIAEHVYDTRPDPDQGYSLKPNNRHRARKYVQGGPVIYDVEYTTDEYGRRTVGQQYQPGRPHLLLFGCSYPFGEGLKNEDTLQHMLGSRIPVNVYNYGVHGYGPQNMLATLESGRIASEVSSRRGIAIFYYGTWDVSRAIGSLSAFWSYDFPYYRFNDSGVLERHGSFRTGRPFVTHWYELLNKSALLRLIRFDTPSPDSYPSLRLTAEIVRRARMEYLQTVRSI